MIEESSREAEAMMAGLDLQDKKEAATAERDKEKIRTHWEVSLVVSSWIVVVIVVVVVVVVVCLNIP